MIEIGQQTIGFIVDSVSQVLRLDRNLIELPSSAIGGVDLEYIMGIRKLDDQLIILIDFDKLISGFEKERAYPTNEDT